MGTAMFEFCSGARQSEIKALTEALAREKAEKEKEKFRADSLRAWLLTDQSSDRIIAHQERLRKRDAFVGTQARGKYGFVDDSQNVEDNSFWLKSSDAIAGEALEMDAAELAKAKAIQSKIATGKLQHLNKPELKDELAAIEGIFKVLDQDGNDTVSKAELLTFFPKNKNLFNSMDYNHDGNISKAEMLLFIDMLYGRDAPKAHNFVVYLKRTAEKKQKALMEHGKAEFAECQETL